MSDKAYITPKVLKWARESARMTTEDAAGKVAVSPEKLTAWEDGASQPTIRQGEVLAKAYRRPFALFFLPEVPRDFQPLNDFRTKGSQPLSTPSIFIIRELQQKQAWIHDVLRDGDGTRLPFVGKYSIQDNPISVARDMVKVLEINPAQYSNDPIHEWIEKAEAKGIFISRTSFIHSKMKLDSEEFQGFAIADEYAPFVFINSEDWDSAQLFTLVHEMAHIWIAQSGISNEVAPDMPRRDRLQPIELFCNQVAANALIPEEIISRKSGVFDSSTSVYQYAKGLGISSFALLVRGLQLNIISLASYNKLKKEADEAFKEYMKREEEKKAKAREREGGPSPYLLRLNKNGRLFTQIVLDSFNGGFIEPTVASTLLNTQVNQFHRFEALLQA